MDLAEYFRIPSSQRLSRLCLANRLNRLSKELGYDKTITPVAFGNWVSSNQVTVWWKPLLTEVLNSPEVYQQTSTTIILK